jgi:flagellar assembly protein FliH
LSKSSIADLYLEDFGRSGAEAHQDHLERQPGFDQISEALLARGRQEGRREAEAAFAAERSGPLARLTELMGALGREREEFRNQNEREIVGLAVAIARRVLRAELKTSPDLLIGRLAEMTAALERESAYQVRVNPDDFQQVSSLLQREGSLLFGEIPFRIKPDPRLPAGAVALEGDRSRIESICSEELSSIESLLLAGLEEEGDDEA